MHFPLQVLLRQEAFFEYWSKMKNSQRTIDEFQKVASIVYEQILDWKNSSPVRSNSLAMVQITELVNLLDRGKPYIRSSNI